MTHQAENHEDGDVGHSWRRGPGRGGGRGRGGYGDGTELWMTTTSPNATAIEGEWADSLGNRVVVEAGPRRRGPLTATLMRGGREQTLSVRCDPSSGVWACGNAVMDLQSSGPSCLVWVAADGRRSVWRREDESRSVGAERPPPDLLPWLLMSEPGADSGGSGAAGTTQATIEVSNRRRWASIAEEREEDAEQEDPYWQRPRKDLPGEEEPILGEEPKAVSASAAETVVGGASDLSVAADASRISALLDVRQVFGSDRNSQEVLTCLLMDHDLLRRGDEDVMVPSLDSPLWGRLAELPRRNALQRLGSFKASDRGFRPEAAPDLTEVRCGRHRIPVALTDTQALMRRWVGPNDARQRVDAMAHVLSLYRTLENPLNPYWERSSMQLSWDPMETKRAGVECELFASPFNARVGCGRYCSRWPHAEALFGSLGAYPAVLSKIPVNVVVSINPPFSDAYLDHVMGQTLDDMVARFKRVCLTVPVREAPWRHRLHRLKGASFVKQFWDSTSLAEKNLAHPVLYWEGSELGPP